MALEIVLLGLITVTGYQPVPAQTKPECKNRYECQTSIDDNVTMYGAAASQDLLQSGEVKYWDVVDVPGFGLRVINDAMGPTKCVEKKKGHCIKRVEQLRAIDLMCFSYEEERRVGIRHMKLKRYRQGGSK